MLEWIIARSGSISPAATAVRLQDEFGSLAAVLFATPSRLKRAVGPDYAAAAEIGAFGTVFRHALRENVADRPILGNHAALVDHLRSEMGHSAVEEFRVLHLDVRNGLIGEEVSVGSIDTAPVYVREVVRRALDVGAAALVIAHNHPTGNPRPSRDDIALTRNLITAARVFEIEVLDHLIITAGSYLSMRSEGLI